MSTKAEAVALEEVEIEAVDSSEEAEVENTREIGAAELKSIAEALIFVADEPISPKTIADLVKTDRETIERSIEELVEEYDVRNGALQLREIAGGWQIATRPEHHEQIRAYLRSRSSANLSLASLLPYAVH